MARKLYGSLIQERKLPVHRMKDDNIKHLPSKVGSLLPWIHLRPIFLKRERRSGISESDSSFTAAFSFTSAGDGALLRFVW